MVCFLIDRDMLNTMAALVFVGVKLNSYVMTKFVHFLRMIYCDFNTIEHCLHTNETVMRFPSHRLLIIAVVAN